MNIKILNELFDNMDYFNNEELEKEVIYLKNYRKLKDEKDNLIKRIIELKDKNVELEKRIYKALCIIDEKRGEYDIPEELEKILKGDE